MISAKTAVGERVIKDIPREHEHRRVDVN